VTALDRWQARIRLARNERPEPEEQIWQRLAAWYDDWTRHNDYVTRVLPRLLARVNGDSRVLEIGPGSGAFTLPLARSVKELVALEPSPNMRAVLEHNLAQAGLGNVRVIPQPVEDGLSQLTGDFDLALASHSLYNVEPMDQVLRDLLRLARQIVILMGTGTPQPWYDALHCQMRGRRRTLPASFRQFYPLLMDLGLYADVEILPTSYNYVYDTEDALVEWWLRHFSLDESQRDELRAALAGLVERRGEYVGVYSVNRSALMWIDRERNVFQLEQP